MAENQPIPADSAAPKQTTEATSDRGSDPARDGLIGIYALRILDRGLDPRLLVAEHRSIRYGQPDRNRRRMAPPERPLAIIEVGRGAAAPAPATVARLQVPMNQRVRARRLALPSLSGLATLFAGRQPAPSGRPRRLVAAG
ncbi:MAG: hypothetical protein M3464_07755 [Chloroflexota bacterium]|nr:hypothetical protein [Chloroflexota bacterium]